MAAPPSAPCAPWTTDEQVRACCGGLDPEYDLTEAIQFASEILFRLSGHRWSGECERTVYPCSGNNCGCAGTTWDRLRASDWNWMYAGYPSMPLRYGDGWVNQWGGCVSKCQLDCVDLPGVVSEVTQVVVDGQVVDPLSYAVQAYRRICRTDGHHWPCSNNLGGIHCVNTDTVGSFAVDATAGNWELTVTLSGMAISVAFAATSSAGQVQSQLEELYGVGNVVVSGGPADAGGTAPYLIVFDTTALKAVPTLAVTASSLSGGIADAVTFDLVQAGCVASEGTWSISYVAGVNPPVGGQMAAALFACQIALNLCGSEGCVLPQRLKEITREGVSMAFADPLTFLDRGEVGIYEVDLWIKSVNPNRLQRRASVYRADSKKPPTNWT